MTNYMHLIYDGIIVAILAYFFLRGRKKGLILALCGLAAFFVAIIGARMASDAFAPKVADMLQPHFSTVIESHLGSGLEEKLDELLTAGEQGDNAIAKLLTTLGFYDEVADTIRSAVSGQAAQTAADVAVALARSVAEVVAGVLVFIVAFLLITVGWFLLSRALDLAARLPILNGLNRTLGGLFGLLQGMLLLFLIAWVLRLLGGVIPQDTVEQTTLLKFFCTTNPISLITGI